MFCVWNKGRVKEDSTKHVLEFSSNDTPIFIECGELPLEWKYSLASKSKDPMVFTGRLEQLLGPECFLSTVLDPDPLPKTDGVQVLRVDYGNGRWQSELFGTRLLDRKFPNEELPAFLQKSTF